jgi:hypothetical protein
VLEKGVVGQKGQYRVKRCAIAVLIVFLVPNLLLPSLGEARYCAGDKERIHFFADWLTRRIDLWMGEIGYEISRAIGIATDRAPLLLFQWTYIQSRGDLVGFMQRTGNGPGNMPGLDQLNTLLLSTWKRLSEIDNPYFSPDWNIPLHVESTALRVGRAWALCRAVSTGRPGPCDLLATEDGNLKKECVFSMVLYGVLYRNKCQEPNTSTVAEVMGVKPEIVRQACKVFSGKFGEGCASLPRMTTVDVQMCRAISGAGEDACRIPALSDTQSEDCLRQVRIWQVLNGRISLEEWKAGKPGQLQQLMIHAAMGNADCGSIALDLYDQCVMENFQSANPWTFSSPRSP